MRARDAVIGDVVFDEWQEYCIRQSTFQRLHYIKQLGNVYHVYPSAKHSRFEHSLGVCYQIKKLVSAPDFFSQGTKPDKHEIKLLELAGLLHDIAHFPFKHTLDRDAAILERAEPVYEYGYRINQLDLKKILTNADIDFLLSVFIADKASDLEKPFTRQMIEDTISADLLDYSQRDVYYTIGSSWKWDERIYDHIAVADYYGKANLVAKIVDHSGNVTQSAVTELVNLLNIRYMLNERVYFNHTKIAADALLVKSVRNFIKYQDIYGSSFFNSIRDTSDEELIGCLVCPNSPKQSSFYAKLLKNRLLPKKVCSLEWDTLGRDQNSDIADSCRGNDCFDKWEKVEETIAKKAGVDPKSIIVYCHDIGMQSKKPNFLVLGSSNGNPEPVAKHRAMEDEIERIAKKHDNLWRCHVYSIDRSGTKFDKISKVAVEILSNVKAI